MVGRGKASPLGQRWGGVRTVAGRPAWAGCKVGVLPQRGSGALKVESFSLTPMLVTFLQPELQTLNKIWYLSIFFFLNVAPVLF